MIQRARPEPDRPKRVAVLQDECREDLRHWVDTNRKVALRVLDLVGAVLRDPFGGIGTPEPLEHLGGDVWSRRVTEADRLVYEVFDDRVEFLQALPLLTRARRRCP